MSQKIPTLPSPVPKLARQWRFDLRSTALNEAASRQKRHEGLRLRLAHPRADTERSVPYMPTNKPVPRSATSAIRGRSSARGPEKPLQAHLLLLQRRLERRIGWGTPGHITRLQLQLSVTHGGIGPADDLAAPQHG